MTNQTHIEMPEKDVAVHVPGCATQLLGIDWEPAPEGTPRWFFIVLSILVVAGLVAGPFLT